MVRKLWLIRTHPAHVFHIAETGNSSQQRKNTSNFEVVAVVKARVFCCLMTPGLSKDIRCHVSPLYTFFSLFANHESKTLGIK